MGLLHVGVADVLEFLQRLSHHVDVVDVQEHQLRVLILVSLVASSCGLEKPDRIIWIEAATCHKMSPLSIFLGHSPSSVDLI